jgi:hypothetical protein
MNKFNDLKEERQESIKKAIADALLSDISIRGTLLELAGSDPYDFDKIDSDGVRDIIDGAIEHGCDRVWNEIVVEVRL